MPRQAVSVLSAIAALTGSLCALTTVTWSSPAHAVEDCAAAPKSVPPQGSHWYYRTDRALQRKCWYLAPRMRKGSKPARLAPQVQSAAEPTATPSMEKVVERPNQPKELEMPATPALPAGESGVSTPEAAPAPWHNPSVDSTEHQKEAASAALAQDYARKEGQDLGSPDQGAMQQSAAAGKIKEPAAAPARTLQFVTGGLAAMGFLTSAFLYFAGARRRRTEVRIIDLNVKAPLRTPASVGSTKPPAPMEMIQRHDEVDADIEDRLRQFSQAWKRRAA